MKKKTTKNKTTKVVKAKVVSKPTPPKPQKSKGTQEPWAVFELDTDDGYYDWLYSFVSKREAEKFVKESKRLLYPVIVHIDLPTVEYISTGDLV